MPVVFVKPFTALFCNWMRISKGVNFSMLQYTSLNLYREMFELVSANVVCKEISQRNHVIIKGKIDMGQEIHSWCGKMNLKFTKKKPANV